tara:strand:+ start:6830 stop:7423 length:594 start_codon:yes stop_codon:yes gene_type:complete
MAKGKINSKSINEKLSKNRKVRQAARAKAQERFNKAKAKAVASFKSHPVTKEIQAGPTSSNSTNTLRGYGNLFSYIGFPVGADPIGPVVSMMENVFKLGKRAKKISVAQRNIKFSYAVTYPDMTDFESVSSMPWEGGSWISGIEKGISGYSNYMYKKSNVSRSGSAFQAPKRIRSGSFKAMDYVSQIIKEFQVGVRI